MATKGIDTSWLDAAQDVPQNTVEMQGPEYPYIQWVNGKPNLKAAGGVPYTGGFFMPESQVNEEPAGWEFGELIHDSGDVTLGYFKRDISVVIIRMRRRWLVYDADGAGFPWNDYKSAQTLGRPTGHLQALCLLKDLESMGPFVLTMKGTICRAFTGGRNAEGVLSRFNRLVIREANSLNAKRGVSEKFPYRAFWLDVGPKRDANGEPVFDEVGQRPNSSRVTFPVALGLSDKPEPGDLAKRFVGKDLLLRLNELYTEAEDWATAWDQRSEPTAAEPADNGGPPPPDFDPNAEDLPF